MAVTWRSTRIPVSVKKVKWFDMAACYQIENRLSYPDAIEMLDHHLHLAVKEGLIAQIWM